MSGGTNTDHVFIVQIRRKTRNTPWTEWKDAPTESAHDTLYEAMGAVDFFHSFNSGQIPIKDPAEKVVFALAHEYGENIGLLIETRIVKRTFTYSDEVVEPVQRAEGPKK